MSAKGQTTHFYDRPTELDPTTLQALMTKYIITAKQGVRDLLVDQSHVWATLNVLIAQQWESVQPSERATRQNTLITSALTELHKDRNRFDAYKLMVGELTRRHEVWTNLIPEAAFSRQRDAELAWYTTWHLLSAGIDVQRVMTLLGQTTPAAPNVSSVPTIDGKRLRGSVFGTWVMLVVLSWVALIWGALISLPFGIGFGILGTLFAGLMLVPLWGTLFGFLGMGAARDSTLRHMGFVAEKSDSELVKAAASFAKRLDIPVPTIGTMPVCNAFAMGSSVETATVAMGMPLMQMLTDEETEAVLGHELGHVVSGDMRRMMLMRTFQNALVWFGLGQGFKQFTRWIICWAAELSILAFSRRREYHADAIGAALAGKEAMIGALRKLGAAPPITSSERTHARFMFRGKLLSTHPSFEQRIAALEAETYLRRLPVKRKKG